MVWTFIYFFLWVLMAVGLSLIMALYLQLAWACPRFQPDALEGAAVTTRDCFSYDLDNCEFMTSQGVHDHLAVTSVTFGKGHHG